MGERAGMITDTVITREQAFESALRGIASCATACGCCDMHVRIAHEALDRAYPVIRRETQGKGYSSVEYLSPGEA